MREDKKGREGFGERLRRTLELDGEMMPHGYTVELAGRQGATVRGAGEILLYTPECIRLGVRGGVISVRGEGLVCVSYSAAAVGIEGRIGSVVFEEVEKK